MRRCGVVCLMAWIALVLWGCGEMESDSGAYNGGDAWTSSDTNTGAYDASSSDWGGGNTNVSLGGAQDFGYFRRLLQDNIVPDPETLDAAGFFAEHHTPLPEPTCGDRVCLQGMLGVMQSLVTESNCTMLQIGLNSPIVADEANRPPLQLGVVVDVSGSMEQAGKMTFVKQGLQRLVNELRDGDRITLITYSNSAQVVFPLGDIELSRNELLNIVSSLSAGGGTNLHAGLELGYQELLASYDSSRQNRLILLSDGIPTSGDTDPEAIISMSRAYNSDGLGLTTVGLGTDFNYTLMRDLADQADGNFYFVEDASAVDEVFTQEISYFTVPVAFDVEIVAEAGSDYRFRAAHGSRLWEDTDTGGRLSVPSVFLAHRDSAGDIEPGEERRGGGSALLLELEPREDDGSELVEGDVATLRLQYREPGTNEIKEQEVHVLYPHAPWLLLPTGYFENAIVEKSFVMLNCYVAMHRACSLFHDDRATDAIAILRRIMAAASDYEDSANGGEGDLDIRLDVELMQELIDVIVANGTDEPSNLELPVDPWPAD